LVGKTRLKELDVEMSKKMKKMGKGELKKLFLANVAELKKANELKSEDEYEKRHELQKEAEIVYKIGRIATVIDKGMKKDGGDLEALEFLLQLFVANLTFGAKYEEQWYQEILAEWAFAEEKTP
jgi:hypothetical protein